MISKRKPDHEGGWEAEQAVALVPDHERRKERYEEAVGKIGIVPPLADQATQGRPYSQRHRPARTTICQTRVGGRKGGRDGGRAVEGSDCTNWFTKARVSQSGEA